MEPDIKSLLTQKIRSIEKEPVTWNKKAVWLNIHGRISAKRSYRVYHYAAAAIFLVLLAINPLQQGSVPDPVDRGQGDIIQADAQPQSDQPSGAPEIKKAGDNDKVFPVHKTDRAEGSLPKVASGHTESVDQLKPVEEEIDVDVTLNYPEPTLICEDSDGQTILPIVGVAGWSDQDVSIARSKKKKLLHKLEPAEKEWGDHSNINTLFFARIK